MDVVKADKKINTRARTTEIDCDQTAMGFPPVKSAIFLIAKSSSSSAY
jgi:hypothetical protein